jgi:hypothetical protein
MNFFGLPIDIHNSEKAEVLHLIKCIRSYVAKDECTTKASDLLQSATSRLLESDSNSNSNEI